MRAKQGLEVRCSIISVYLYQYQYQLIVDLGVERCVVISTMLMCDASDIVGYDRRRPALAHRCTTR